MGRADCRRSARGAKRLQELRARVEALGGIVPVMPGCPPEIEERFLEQVLAFELEGEGPPLVEHLRQQGVQLPSPDELDDADLPAKLLEIIETLGRLRVYLRSTDHLTDRELYRYLCEELLEEPTYISGDPNSFWQFDVIGGGSEEDITIYLRYYADDEERSRWAAEFPDMPIPEREKLPFDRDRHLPRPLG